ncbi:hypothetical protein BDN71DRAFT_737620 [Pleurotus eryngii]|uniref:Non-haem dioxygenase N-terminal domain-containing protein n=1 Tax=Pleurotus eryngii TaxID=5323 RepID=A0A9P5ZG40_PLEER|nr:hypothetical protein BDN71DRAFT_737620 [Pleurotus eryngii]
MILSIIAVAVDFADLAVIDLSKGSAPEGQAELVQQVRKALSEVGFFYVINHGYTPSETARIFDIASLTFDQISDEEKKENARKDQAVYRGYKLRKEWLIPVTILYSQPIGGLEILSEDNKWRWIKHIDNAIVRNFTY